MEITVRHIEPGDYTAIHAIYASPKVIWGTLQLPFPSAEQWRKRLSEPPEGLYNLVACADSEVVGQLGLHTSIRPRRRHVANLGMAVRDDWQGKGIGSALMRAAVDLSEQWLNIERIQLDVYTDNEPAVRLYQKFGFVIEGTLAHFAFRDGRYVNAYVMARLRQPGM